MDERINIQRYVCKGSWMNGWMDGLSVSGMDERTDGWPNGCMDEWMDKLLDG